ncbi:TetR family transcriptional regulator [Devosia sp.]|uniref:TetR family transcriptional regulator n=1 Tax=Devosia sp. TaxID=1871048 RepID=UPI003BAD21FF
MDLRQRRKLETTKLIREAAIGLARDNGVQTVTVEAICEAAGISQRTFFNYFPFKEAALVLPPPPLPPEAVARFVSGNADLVADLIDLMVAQVTEMNGSRWIGKLMREVTQAYPLLIPLQMAEFHKFELQLQALVAGRLRVSPDNVRCLALAGAVIGAVRATFDRWRDDDQADLPLLVRESLESLVETIRFPSLKS